MGLRPGGGARVISVLVPSRGRPESLAGSVSSLLGNAANPDGVEILVALDPDDDGPYADLRLGPRVWFWTAPERYGYARLERYYNHLATMANGDWLLGTWNDDARMLTQDWDAIIEQQDPAVLWLGCTTMGGGNFWPAWPAAWTKAIGHVALVSNVDVWMSEIGRRLHRERQIPVEVHHDRYDVTGGHDDQTYAEGRAVMGAFANHPDYDTPDNRAARIRDTVTIRRLLESA